MKIGSQYEADRVLPRHWEQLCLAIHYSYPALKRLVKTQGESILKAMTANKAHYIEATRNALVINALVERITKNIMRTLKQFETI